MVMRKLLVSALECLNYNIYTSGLLRVTLKYQHRTLRAPAGGEDVLLGGGVVVWWWWCGVGDNEGGTGNFKFYTQPTPRRPLDRQPQLGSVSSVTSASVRG